MWVKGVRGKGSWWGKCVLRPEFRPDIGYQWKEACKKGLPGRGKRVNEIRHSSTWVKPCAGISQLPTAFLVSPLSTVSLLSSLYNPYNSSYKHKTHSQNSHNRGSSTLFPLKLYQATNTLHINLNRGHFRAIPLTIIHCRVLYAINSFQQVVQYTD